MTATGRWTLLVLCGLLGARPSAAEPAAAESTPAASVPAPAVAPAPAAAAAEVEQLLGELLLGMEQRKAARTRIIAIGGDATDALIAHFHSPEFTIRWEVANILGNTRDVRGVGALVERVLNDPNPHIRWRSLWALGNMEDQAIPDRFRQLLGSEDEAVRWNAAVAGSMFGVQEALPELQAGLSSSDEFRAWEAVNALARILDPSSVAKLAVVLGGEVQRLRREAVLTLGKLKEFPHAVAMLVSALDDSDPGVRWRAAMSLGAVDDATVQAAFRRRLEVEVDPEVRRHLERSPPGRAGDSAQRPAIDGGR